jgi:hypothetical protein
VLHDRVEVVSVEGAEHLLKDLDPAIVGHPSSSLAGR